jgi:hypothetical protein
VVFKQGELNEVDQCKRVIAAEKLRLLGAPGVGTFCSCWDACSPVDVDAVLNLNCVLETRDFGLLCDLC